MTIEVSLTPEWEQFIQQHLASGLFSTADDLVIEGLQALRDRLRERQQKLESLRADVDVALEESRQGKTVDFDETVAEAIKATGRLRLSNPSHPIT